MFVLVLVCFYNLSHAYEILEMLQQFNLVVYLLYFFLYLFLFWIILLCRESLYEDEEFDLHQRQLAALLVSKVKINRSAFLIICFKLVCDRQDWLLLSEFTCELHPKDSTWLKINTWKLRTISKREILNNYIWIWSVGVQICVSLHPILREDCIFHWICKFYYLIFSLLDLCFSSPRFSTIWVNLMTHFPMPLELVPCLMCQTILIMFILFLVRMFLCFFYLYERERIWNLEALKHTILLLIYIRKFEKV